MHLAYFIVTKIEVSLDGSCVVALKSSINISIHLYNKNTGMVTSKVSVEQRDRDSWEMRGFSLISEEILCVPLHFVG